MSVKRILLSKKGRILLLTTRRPPSQFAESCSGFFLLHMHCSFCRLLFIHKKNLFPPPVSRVKNCNPQRLLRYQNPGFHLKRRQKKQPYLHVQKPGSCVSLLPVTRSRSRRVRKARPCCGAARPHVAFHNKHFHRSLLLLFMCLSVCLPDCCLRRGPSRTAGRDIIFTPKRATCVIFLRPSSSGSSLFSASNQAKGSSKLLNSHLQFRNDPISPDLSSLLVMPVPCCIFSSKRPSLSAPRFCC